MTGVVRFEADAAVATITLDAPRTRNALTPRMLCMLCDAFKAFAADHWLRVAVITGAGEQAFCAGGDLASTIPLLTGERHASDEWDERLLHDPDVMAASTLRDFPLHKPVIAAINGACMAAGFELMLGTDLRVAAGHATFALPEVRRGVIPFGGSTVRLPRQVPHCVAMELLIGGEPLTARAARRAGLVNRVVPAAQVMPTALDIARRVADHAPLAVRAIKRTVEECSGRPLAEGYAIEDRAWREVLATQDAREGPRAFLEKRPARFQGR
jgi:enoyl-CoA hydratase